MTGASAGIGWAICHKLALEGLRVVAVARRRERLEALQQNLVRLGVPIADFLPVVCNITKVTCAPTWMHHLAAAYPWWCFLNVLLGSNKQFGHHRECQPAMTGACILIFTVLCGAEREAILAAFLSFAIGSGSVSSSQVMEYISKRFMYSAGGRSGSAP